MVRVARVQGALAGVRGCGAPSDQGTSSRQVRGETGDLVTIKGRTARLWLKTANHAGSYLHKFCPIAGA